METSLPITRIVRGFTRGHRGVEVGVSAKLFARESGSATRNVRVEQTSVGSVEVEYVNDKGTEPLKWSIGTPRERVERDH